MPGGESDFVTMERRKNERHRVAGTAWFRWKDAEGAKQELRGNLRNVSSGGIFIETISPPPVGTEILIQFQFDSSGRNHTPSITTRGQVSRVEVGSLNDPSGFAASTRRMNLRRT
jgi:hypothetical protein